MAVQRLRSSAAGTVVPTMIASSELSSVIHTLRRQGPNTHTDPTLIVTSTRLHIIASKSTSSSCQRTRFIITSKHPPHHHVKAPTSSSRQSTHIITTSKHPPHHHVTHLAITSEHPPHHHVKAPTSPSRQSTHLTITSVHPPHHHVKAPTSPSR